MQAEVISVLFGIESISKFIRDGGRTYADEPENSRMIGIFSKRDTAFIPQLIRLAEIAGHNQ